MNKPCAFNMQETGMPPGYECPGIGTQCGWCACSGPCVHEMNPVCDQHAGFIQGWITAQPEDPEDEEGLNIVDEAAARFIRLIHPTITQQKGRNMEIHSTHPGDRDSDEAIAKIGLPSRLRYNYFVRRACDALNSGGISAADIWATLALAEATLVNER